MHNNQHFIPKPCKHVVYVTTMFPDCCPTGAELNPIICIITSQAFNFSISVCRSVEYRATVGILIKTKKNKKNRAKHLNRSKQMNAVNYRFPQGYNKHKMYSMSYKKWSQY